MFFSGLSCQYSYLCYEPQPTSTSLGDPSILGRAGLWTCCRDSLDSSLALLLHMLAYKAHSCQSQSIFFCGNTHCPFIYSTDRVYLVDYVDLICSLYGWWKVFWSSFLVTLPLELNCGFIPTSASGLSTWVSLWGFPGGLGSAPGRTRHGGGMATWIIGIQVEPDAQGSQCPWAQEIWVY